MLVQKLSPFLYQNFPVLGLIFSPFFGPPFGVESVSERASPTLLFKTPFRTHFLPPFFIPFLPLFFIPILPSFFIPFYPLFLYHYDPRFSYHSYPRLFITSPDSPSNVLTSPGPVPSVRILITHHHSAISMNRHLTRSAAQSCCQLFIA